MDCVVAPLFQSQELPAEAVSKTFNPWQKVVTPPAVMLAIGIGFTKTFVVADMLRQEPFVTATENEPDVETVIDWVVAPLFHKYEVPVLAVNTTLPPWQNVIGPAAVIAACVICVIVSVTGVLLILSQPVLVFLLAA